MGRNLTSRWMAILLLVAAAASQHAQVPDNAAATGDSIATGNLTVWIQCRQKKDADAMATARAASLEEDYPGAKFQFKTFSYGELLGALNAAGKSSGQSPDVVFVDSGVDILIKAGPTAMVGKPRVAATGSWLIPTSSPNPKLARAFIVWLEQPLKLPKLDTQLLPPDNVDDIRKVAIAAVEGFGENYKTPGVGVLDSAVADFAWNWDAPGPGTPRQQSYKVNVDMLGGNQRLAFAGVSALEEGDNFYGLHHAAVILRRQSAAWQVLMLIPDLAYPEMMNQLKTLDIMGLQNDLQSGLTYLALLSPANEARLPRSPRPEFAVDQEGELGRLLAFESQTSSSADRKSWSPTSLTNMLINGPKADHIVHFPVTLPFVRKHYRWRVWSVNQSGAVTLSEWRTMELTN